jgi:hypothetical protein
MKILTRIGAGIVILILLILFVALFTKDTYVVEKEITVNKPKTTVFQYVSLLRNGDQFNKWVMADPNMNKKYSGTDGTKGFVYAWESRKEEVGKGEQEITKVVAGDSLQPGQIDYEIRFIKPFEGKADSYISTTPKGPAETQVKWYFSSKMPYPMNFILLFVKMENMLGKDLEASLSNLKSNLEKQ